MSIFKCKMCGGALEVVGGETVATCEYCGTQQTLPRLDDDRRVNLYDRANHFRRNNEFDKAMGIYEQILTEDGSDAEAYWSLVLCRYGIEYVEDPTSHKRIPTVNRAQFTSIFDDDNYKSALQYADASQRTIYEQEARAINEIQKGILAISQQEEPFDVFICYKETDANGRRTPDSVLANDLYHQLTQEGFKVFFARITLEDKLGSAYEPYIFAALNSAKVMVVLGTRPEYFNAVWVKNEWSRYLSLIKQGQKKMLIPAYKDMDPYDLPEEFSHLQAQDMSKLGFMQDLIRGIKKIAQSDEPKQTVVKETVVTGGNASAASTASLLKRAFMFLEDGEWNSAIEYCEKVLDIDPETAQAYLGKLMAELQVRRQDDLKNCAEPFDGLNNYKKTIRFADEPLRNALQGYISYIKERNETARLNRLYSEALSLMQNAKAGAAFKEAAKKFFDLDNFKDSQAQAEKCLELAETARKDQLLERARERMGREKSYKAAEYLLKQVAGWKDADELLQICEQKMEEEERQEAERTAKRNKKVAIIALVAVAVIAFLIVLFTVIIPNAKYNKAVDLMDAGEYEEAIAAFEATDGYRDSAEKIEECMTAELKTASVGDYVYFGSYEQDNDTSNGKEAIEWLVLDIQDGRTLLISKYGLDCQPYNEERTTVTWETCTLRKWLNDAFINAAFSADEKAMIPTVTVSADKNPDYSTNPGNATQDQVFLLSITEANKYFSSDSARQCKPTEYAVAGGVYVNSSNGNCWWWLRSPGRIQRNAANVISDGDVNENGDRVYYVDTAVRPALWVEIGA